MKKLVIIFVLCAVVVSCAKTQTPQYTEADMQTLPREELMKDGGKTFYIISDAPVGGFCKRAQVFTEENGKFTVYVSVKDNIMYDRVGTQLIDGSEYGKKFYAWIFEKYQQGTDGFFVYCYWGSENSSSTTDPLILNYSREKDLLYIWRPDPSLYS